MAYTTKAKVEGMFGITIPASADGTITTLIAAAKLWIDKYVGKTFEGVSETRYYDGNGFSEIIIDPFTTLTSVKILNSDGTTYDTLTAGQADDYIALPMNSSEKYSIRLTGNGYWGRFQNRARLLEVTGVFGATVTVPADVEIAATKMVGSFFNESGGEGNLTAVSLGDYSASYAKWSETADALGITSILDQYREVNI